MIHLTGMPVLDIFFDILRRFSDVRRCTDFDCWSQDVGRPVQYLRIRDVVVSFSLSSSSLALSFYLDLSLSFSCSWQVEIGSNWCLLINLLNLLYLCELKDNFYLCTHFVMYFKWLCPTVSTVFWTNNWDRDRHILRASEWVRDLSIPVFRQLAGTVNFGDLRLWHVAACLTSTMTRKIVTVYCLYWWFGQHICRL